MPQTEPTREAVEQLAEEFVARYRRGERPAISEYTQKFPGQEVEVREVLEAAVMIERLAPASELGSPPSTGAVSDEGGAPLEQLGDFRIIREVGRGGMGIVYEAEQVSLGRRVALKLLPKQSLLDSKHQKRFLREAKAAARLHHTNIVPVFGVGQQDGLHYYVMQFIHGLGLDEVLVELQRQRELSGERVESPELRVECAKREVSAVAVANSLVSGHFDRTLLADSEESDHPSVLSDQRPSTLDSGHSTLDSPSTVVSHLSDTFPGHSVHTSKHHSRQIYWQSVARIGHQSAQALQYAHDQGIIHRDVKPGNLLLDTRGSVWVTDFGLAKAADQQDLTHTGDVLGTLRYMAPEQFEGKADALSDVFSLGLTLYELLALKPAFDERDRHKLIKQVTTGAPPRLRTLDPHIPRDLETIVHKAIDRDPAHRYQTANEMAADLQRYLGNEPIRARWVSPVTRFARWCKRNPAVAGLTSTIAVLLVAAAVVSSVAAVRFENLAEEKSSLATEKGSLAKRLETALDKAESNLDLAITEQTRAEGNLDLALEALDAVYLDAIGQEKLLREPASLLDSEDMQARVLPDLSEFEKELLRRGLTFYERFTQQNSRTPRAAIQTAQANYRVGLLYAGLGENEEAEAAYLAAVERFETLARQRPRDVGIWRQLSDAYDGYASLSTTWEQLEARARQLDAHLTTAIAQLPEEPDLYLLRGNVRHRLHDATGANQDYENALTLGPTNADLLLSSFQRSHSEDGSRRDLSARIAQHIVSMDESNWRGQLALAQALGTAVSKYLATGRGKNPYESPPIFVMHDSERALAHFDTVAELAPDRPEVFAARARFNCERRHYDEALADLDRAAALGADDRVLRSRILIYSDKHELATAVLGDMIRVNADNPRSAEYWRAHEFLAKIAGKEGRYEDAVQHLIQAIDSSPGAHWMFCRRAYYRAKSHDFVGALADIEQHIKMPGGMAGWQVANILQDCPENTRAQAFEIAETAAENATNKAAALASLAEMYGNFDEWERASRAMVRASLAGEESSEILQQWGRLLVKQNELESAAAKYERAVELKPDDWMLQLELAGVEFRLKQWEDAAEDYSQVIAHDGSHFPAAWGHYSQALYQLGRYPEARQGLEKTIELRGDNGPNLNLGPRWWFYAMTLWRVGETERSRNLLDELEQLFAELPQEQRAPHARLRAMAFDLIQGETADLSEEQSASSDK